MEARWKHVLPRWFVRPRVLATVGTTGPVSGAAGQPRTSTGAKPSGEFDSTRTRWVKRKPRDYAKRGPRLDWQRGAADQVPLHAGHDVPQGIDYANRAEVGSVMNRSRP